MKKTAWLRVACFGSFTALGAAASQVSGCASDQKSTASAEQARDGEALSPAPAPPPPSDATTTETHPAPAASGDAAPSASPEAPAKEALNEAQIAKVSEVVNTAEVEQAKVALSKAKAPGVKRFAEKMIKHHGDALKAQAKLVKNLKIEAADSATATALKANGDEVLAKLKSSEAASFDAAYVDSQIEAHEKVLVLLDTQLIPGAKTPDVLNALRMARGAVEQHLNEARALR